MSPSKQIARLRKRRAQLRRVTGVLACIELVCVVVFLGCLALASL